MKIPKIFSRILFQKSIATLLVMMILVSQTIHVDFFDSVEAGPENYRDIVSIIVDRDTYGSERTRIKKYAEDIAGYLGGVRTSILVVDPETPVATIAAKNEKLYYEGDGERGTSSLVGTVLIGNIPIPTVEKDGVSFASLYPYVDFTDKVFAYDPKNARYSYNQTEVSSENVDIWHGVINPAVGRTWSGSTDISKIGQFLDKTHEFYTKSGKFVPATTPPRVFYYDRYLEQKSIDYTQLPAYALLMKHAEEIIYNRFSKYLLGYIVSELNALKKNDQSDTEKGILTSLGVDPATQDSVFPLEQLAKMPDVQTRIPAMQLMKQFYELVNKKTLSDIRAAVHNAGRYNIGSNVSVDQPTLLITIADQIAMNIVKSTNDKFEEYIDEVEVGYEKNAGAIGAMPPFDSTTINDPIDRISRTYNAYIFGKPVSEMDDIVDCSIARGSDTITGPYKQGILVEANQAFNGYSTADNVKNFERDGKKKVNCAPSGIDTLKTDTYWGKNIMTNIDVENWTFKQPSWIGGYYENIFSLGGMNEVNTSTGATRLDHMPGGSNTSTIVPLASNSCYALGLAYMLQEPRGKDGGEPWPKKESGEIAGDPAITCLTKQEEHSHTSWEGKNVPYAGRFPPHEFDWIASSAGPGDDPQSFAPALAGPKGICEFGQIAIYKAPKIYFSGGTVTPKDTDFSYACLPSAGEKCALQPGELISEKCLPKNLNQYIDKLVLGGVKGDCPLSNPQTDVLYKTACGILGDDKHGAAEGGNFRNKYEQDIPGGWGAMFHSPCAALAAVQKEGEGVVQTNTAINLCMAVEDPMTAAEGLGLKKDLTTYETAVFKDIKDSRVYHKSPTNEEITAAQNASATPSIPIDHDRYISFAQSVGGEYKIKYPNLFRFNLTTLLTKYANRISLDLKTVRGKERVRQYGSGAATAITAYRLELDSLGKDAWTGIPLSGGALLTANPPDPACWGGQFSDAPICKPSTPGYRTEKELIEGPLTDAEIYETIRAKNWLHPDISGKYQSIVSATLSYSGTTISTGATLSGSTTCDLSRYLSLTGSTSTGALSDTSCVSEPPRFPKTADGYEIAYLGLTPYDGADAAWHGDELAAVNAYAVRLSEIEGANISEEGSTDDPLYTNKIPNPATQCGPPDGVPLQQWPSAIMCWIKAQFPPKILAGSCGPTTIGLSSTNSAGIVTSDVPSSLPVTSVPVNIVNNTLGLQAFYTGSRLIAHMPRSSMQLADSMPIDLSLQAVGTILSTPPGSRAHLEIISAKTSGRDIKTIEMNQYITIAPTETLVGEKKSSFALQSHGKPADIELRGYYLMPMPDGTDMRIDSVRFHVNISAEYLSLQLEQSGSTIFAIDATSSDPIRLAVTKIAGDSMRTPFINPVSLRIYDDVSGAMLYSGSDFVMSRDALPVIVTKKTGVYRLVADRGGLSGEMTFAVRSGDLAQIRIVPISSVLVSGSRTLAMIRLLDRLSNPISPTLHSLSIDITGGYMIDSTGERRTKMTLDIMEAQIPMIIGSDTPGSMRIKITSDTTLSSSTDITVYETARIVLMRDRSPQVGGARVPTHIEVQDASGSRITGLSSLASWTLPAGAGSFSKSAITITDGISEPFDYMPGTVAGDHTLSIDIPGIGSVSDMVFSVLPGAPLYIDHIREGGSLIFSLRDRYGNIAHSTLSGSIMRNSDPARIITFATGSYRTPLKSGYYTVDVPGLTVSSISYTDEVGIHTISGISKYVVYIADDGGKMEFAPDYNARYTILAGGEFLREGEDILYNTAPGRSQSLAVSTSLENPHKQDILFSLLPGGAYRIGQSIDTAIQTSISLQEHIPLLTVSDITTHKQIARILYPMQDAQLSSCKGPGDLLCQQKAKKPTIQLIIPDGSTLTGISTPGVLTLKSDISSILSIYTNGGIYMSPDTTLIPDDTGTLGLSMRVMQSGRHIATLVYITDSARSVERSLSLTAETPRNTPVILSSGFSLIPVSVSSSSIGIYGYQIVRPTRARELDESRNGPSDIDPIGFLEEIPGVGWLDRNTMLLSYAGGDTVGEASKFFHTYTLINMGDPVAHVDHGRTGTEIDGVDRSIGSIVARGNQSRISDFFHRDMDADGLEDLLVAYDNGYVELFINRGGKFRSRGMITYNRDLDSKRLMFGDFIHDGYSDLVGIDKKGNIVLVDNDVRRFARPSITLEGGAIMPTHISQFRIADMDADTRDDIVYITAGGELGILYGTPTRGSFVKKILDPTLGISLSTTPIITGGAIRSSSTPATINTTGVSASDATSLDEGTLQAEVYYNYTRPIPASTTRVDIDTLSGALDTLADGTTRNVQDTYVRSQYASAYGLQISKQYTNATHATLYPDDLIRAHISIKNTSPTVIKNIEYLDTIPQIFSLEKTLKYTLKIGGTSTDRSFESLPSGDYDMHFVGRDLAPGETLDISYDLIALPASYGEMIVGDLERGTVGADIYGDVGFKTSTTCGASMLLWASGPGARDYTRGTHDFGSVDLPAGIADQITDTDHNGIPDKVEKRSIEDLTREKDTLVHQNQIGYSGSIFNASQDEDGMSMGFDDGFVDKISETLDTIESGLSCGFGGGSCLNSPLNGAPLAPGGSPSILGIPVNIAGMSPSVGLPVFSSLTGIPSTWGCIPAVWPISPLAYVPGTCGLPSAGGILGTWAPTNTFRVFVTPTLTLGMGAAFCFGGPAITAGNTPSPALSPLIQGGNCIVVAAPMPFCKDDGSISDGNVAPISGLGNFGDLGGASGGGGSTWNANSCTIQPSVFTDSDDQVLTTDVVSYLRSPDPSRLSDLYARLGKRGSQPLSGGPLLTVSAGSGGGDELSMEIDSNTSLRDILSVIKIKNTRIAAFPDFIMDWLDRQISEITTALLTTPTLTIIPPTDFGQNAQVDGSYKDFFSKLGSTFSQANLENMKQGVIQASQTQQSSTAGVPSALQGAVATGKSTLNGIKAAYTFIGKLPFITLRQTNVPINIPWILPSELDRYQRVLQAYPAQIQSELERAARDLCITDPSPTCLAKKGNLNTGAFIASVNENLKRIEEYKRFPLKIQKYITWKEHYIAQILCNIDTIQQLTGGWIRDNGVRFRKWAELYVLIKAIADGWQPLIELFKDATTSCAPCRNERYTLQYWKFKLLSMLIPSIPIIRFPRWPDIVLDLSDIRLGINISLPNFEPRISPLRLPDLPSLSIGSLSVSLTLPPLPLLPAIPPLPDLPDLPSLPKIKLPDLPPPPKLPKIAGAIKTFLNVMRLISKMYCYYQKTVLVPEWQVGDVIADRTARQGTLPIDFLKLQLPDFALPSIKEIRVATHVNFEIRSDFISEFARSVVAPINQFSTDLNLAIPKKLMDDVVIPSQNIDLNTQLQSYHTPEDIRTATGEIAALYAGLAKEKDVYLETQEFGEYLLSQLESSGQKESKLSLQRELATADIESTTIENELLTYNDTRFSLLRDYLASENNNTAQLQSIVDLLSRDVSEAPRQLISDTLSTSTRSTHLLEQFNNYQGLSSQTPASTDMAAERGLDASRSALQGKLSRMIAATTGGASATSGTPLADGYAPKYQGIYVLTAGGTQTRLFDYIAPVLPSTRVDSLDIDRDGDIDYIYILDGNLYIKYGHDKTANKIVDTTMKISDISATDLDPYVPDYFHASISTPRNLSFSFVPASQTETEWRAEFYDRYMEWDHVDIGDHIPMTAPKTTIDMFLSTSSTLTSTATLRSTPAKRALVSVRDTDSFIIEGRSIDIYTGALSISLSPGRVLYTGQQGMTITYKNEKNPIPKSHILEPYTGYEFSSITEITTTGGKLYLIGGEDQSRYTYRADLIGLPILPGMRLYASDTGAVIADLTSHHDISLSPGSTYITYDLGDRSHNYAVSIPYANGYYSARLHNLTDKQMDRAGVILIPPQASSDDGEPIVDLPTRIRLPIYSTRSYRITDILTDLSAATIAIDSDPSVDTDHNGVFDDDFASAGPGFSISSQEISFGPFATPGKYKMSLRAIDAIGNTSTMPLTVDTYALIPQIQSVTATGTLIGSLSEPIASTPIHFFRVRPGEAPLLLSSGSTLTDILGAFATGSFFQSPEIITLRKNQNIASITSRGVLTLQPGYHTEVASATPTDPMRILVVDQTGSISHIHTISLPTGVRFIDTSRTATTATGVLLTPTAGVTRIVPASQTDTSIPGGQYITDTSYRPLAAIGRDGNIYTLDPLVTLRYRSKDGYMSIELVRQGIVVAAVEYRIDFFYTMR